MPKFLTVDEAVRWYLSHAGCGDLRDIRMHTEHKWTEGETAAALKRIGARKLHMPTGWEQVRPFRDGEYADEVKRSRRRPSMFALQEAGAA